MAEQIRRVGAGLVTVALAAIVLFGLFSGEPSEPDRIASLGNRIRCPVCQGEPISESSSETARAMLVIVQEKVSAGESDDAIIGYFRDRYGEFIVLDPPFRGTTLILWLLPVAALVGGVVLILGRVRRKQPDGQMQEAPR